jgi:hypothetical protein
MTVPDRESTERLAAWLLTIADDVFRDVVAQDVAKRLDPETAAALRHPRVLVRWTRMLKVLLKDAHVQMAEKRNDPARGPEWRVKVARWEASIEASRTEAQTLLERHGSEAQREESLRAKRARGELYDAAVQRLISAHRDEFRQIMDEERKRAGIPLPVRPGATRERPHGS